MADKASAMIAAILPAITAIIGKAIDKAVPDKDQAERIKADVTAQALSLSATELTGAIDIIKAEAQGESWLQRNWRPVLMLWFAGLVGAHWLGFTPANLSEPTVIKLLSIVQVGVGGYIVGRSGEKIAAVWKAGG